MARRHVDRVDLLALQPVCAGGPPLVQVYTEECKRVSTCRACMQPILANTRRFVIESWHHTKSRRERAFFHVGCIAGLAEETEQRPDNHCAQCDAPTPYNTKRYGLARSTHRGHEWLCASCAESGHYAQCSWCMLYYPPSKTTWTVAPAPVLRVCKRCVDNRNREGWDVPIRTRSDVLREARDQRKFEKLQESLKNQENAS